MTQRNPKKVGQSYTSGQGVIEYAGALVIAALVVSGMMSIGPDGIMDVFLTVVDTVEGVISNQLTTL